jgi:hypothetical protein
MKAKNRHAGTPATNAAKHAERPGNGVLAGLGFFWFLPDSWVAVARIWQRRPFRGLAVAASLSWIRRTITAMPACLP